MITILHTVCQSLTSIINRHYFELPITEQIKQLGETLYQNKEYEQAYRLFVGLEDYQDGNNSHIYTSQRYQIRCLVQLGKTELAIKKCQFILQQSPKSASWYLLTAEIYLHDQQYTLAWQLLKNGLTWISDHDPQWEELCIQERLALEGSQLHQLSIKSNPHSSNFSFYPPYGKKKKMNNNNHQQLSNSFHHDYHHPIQTLSYDLLCNIFMMLPFEHLIKSIRVCRQWKEIILQSPLLWQQFVFMNSKIPVHHNTIQHYLSRLQNASLLTFRIDKAFDGECLLLSLSNANCSQLHTLDLSSLQCTTNFSFILFRDILTSAGKTLKKLRIGSNGFKLNSIIEEISNHCQQLETLDVYDCFTSAGNYSIPLQLDNTAIYRLEQFGESFSEAYMEYVDQLPTLPIRYLNLSTIHGLSTIHLATILLRCPHLIHLDLDRCLINLVPIINILRFSCPKLEVLSYHRNRFTQYPINTSTFNPIITSSVINNNNNNNNNNESSTTSSLIRQQQQRRHHSNKNHSLLNRPHRLPMKLISPPSSPASSSLSLSSSYSSLQSLPSLSSSSSFLASSSSSMTVNNNNNNKKNETSFWKQLSLKHSRTLTDDLLHFILKGSYHTIEKLNIKENPRLTDDCLFHMIKRQQHHQQQQEEEEVKETSTSLKESLPPSLPSLKEFDLSYCMLITEKGLRSLLRECPTLTSINLSGLLGVTDQVLLTMANHCQQLTHIYLNHCHSITDQGIKQFIHIFLQKKNHSSNATTNTALFQQLELNKTKLSMECIGYTMCFIERDGI